MMLLPLTPSQCSLSCKCPLRPNQNGLKTLPNNPRPKYCWFSLVWPPVLPEIVFPIRGLFINCISNFKFPVHENTKQSILKYSGDHMGTQEPPPQAHLERRKGGPRADTNVPEGPHCRYFCPQPHHSHCHSKYQHTEAAYDPRPRALGTRLAALHLVSPPARLQALSVPKARAG